MRWTESVLIARPVAAVQRAIADEHELLKWSAWPDATGYSCRIDGDGRSPGSAIVFTDTKGVTQGRQVLYAADERTVDYRLRNRGPGGREMTPQLTFRLEDIDGRHTRVHLDFSATAPLPPGLRQLVEAAMARRVRRLHIKDLEQLKAYAEEREVR